MTLEEYNVLIDSAQANRGRHVNEFFTKYMQLPREYLELTNLPELLYNLCPLVERDIIRRPGFFQIQGSGGAGGIFELHGNYKDNGNSRIQAFEIVRVE